MGQKSVFTDIDLVLVFFYPQGPIWIENEKKMFQGLTKNTLGPKFKMAVPKNK